MSPSETDKGTLPPIGKGLVGVCSLAAWLPRIVQIGVEPRKDGARMLAVRGDGDILLDREACLKLAALLTEEPPA